VLTTVPPVSWISTLWGLWVLIWVVSARWTAKTIAHQSSASRLVQTALFLGAGFLLFLARRDQASVPVPPSLRAVLAWAGLGAVALGLGFAVWARFHLGRYWSGTVTLKTDHRVVMSGPYGLVRHPIYTGILVAALGTALARDSVLGALGFGLMTLGFVLKYRDEERLLTEHLGDAYRSYRQRVPALVPRFW
jgi:protein-S-isoprenylcysteine O-methyltransferase Ste14